MTEDDECVMPIKEPRGGAKLEVIRFLERNHGEAPRKDIIDGVARKGFEKQTIYSALDEMKYTGTVVWEEGRQRYVLAGRTLAGRVIRASLGKMTERRRRRFMDWSGGGYYGR